MAECIKGTPKSQPHWTERPPGHHDGKPTERDAIAGGTPYTVGKYPMQSAWAVQPREGFQREMGDPHAPRIRCGAKNRDGSPCKTWAVRGRKRCRMHGGKTPVGGAAHPTYTGGRYSKVLPPALKALYEAAANAPDLLSQEPEAAILTARMVQLQGNIRDAGETARMWRDAAAAHRRWQLALAATAAAQGRNDAAAVDHHSREAATHAAALGAILEAGAGDSERWEEYTRTVDTRRKVVESERKRLVEASQMLPFAQVCVIFDALIETLRKEITNGDQLARITAELAGLLGRPHPTAA